MGIVVLLILFGGMWMLLIRPQQQRLRAQRRLVASLDVGDEVVTAGGVVARIVRLDDQEAALEVAPGVVITFLRAAISRRLEPGERGEQADDAIGSSSIGGPAIGGTGPTSSDTGTTGGGELGEGPAAAGTQTPASAPTPTGAPTTTGAAANETDEGAGE